MQTYRVIVLNSESPIRPHLEQTIGKLLSLGATHVLTYDQLYDRLTRDKINSWTNGKVKIWLYIAHHTRVLNVLVEGDSARSKLYWYDSPHKNDQNPHLLL